MGVRTDAVGHYRAVDDAQALDAAHPAVGPDDGELVITPGSIHLLQYRNAGTPDVLDGATHPVELSFAFAGAEHDVVVERRR